jgi:hypothetical protein
VIFVIVVATRRALRGRVVDNGRVRLDRMDRRTFLRQASGLAAGTVGGALPGALLPACTPDRGSPGGGGSTSAPPIDRRALVDRHAPVVRAIDPFSVLTVGNGEFAFTADVTGLQSLPDAYPEIPLATQASWAWHRFPNPSGYQSDDAMSEFRVDGRTVTYADQQGSPAGQWLRQNPHRLSLARVGFALRKQDGSPARPEDLQEIEQRLDLWTGTLDSRLRFEGHELHVWTCVHPDRHVLAVRIEAPSLPAPRRAIRIAFPYGAAVHTGDPSDWSGPERHRTTLANPDPTHAHWHRTLDEDSYHARAAWSEGGRLIEEAEHTFCLTPPDGSGAFDLVIEFSATATPEASPAFADVRSASATRWEQFWTSGGAIDLSGSTDARAPELERRIVLSQYLTAIQCAGSMPPQETGLTFNSWHGKFHLEMHWWHAVHFALWGRLPMLERSLPWYQSILQVAQTAAARQGYAGARWPKMVGPDGRESPSTIGVFLIWQQPHPIYFAEMVYRTRPETGVLQTYREIVFETAAFMASFARRDAAQERYVLGPPLIPAQELHPARSTFNPTFELAYWAFGLETAQRWRVRLGMPRHPDWDHVLQRLSPLPMRDGLYTNAESDPDTFTDVSKRRDHPTLLGAYGFIGSPAVDREAMRRTLRRVLSDWQWKETWGWDYPLVAMTATRVGEPELAIDALMMNTPKNRYHPNGHNYQRPGLTIYLPGNGGLLAAVAMMAAGWDGGPDVHAPGFPSTGWRVTSERLSRMI